MTFDESPFSSKADYIAQELRRRIVDGTLTSGAELRQRTLAEQFGVSYDEMEQRYRDRASLRRMVSPQDIAAMVVFLCSEAGRNITGQALSVCGGVDTL